MATSGSHNAVVYHQATSNYEMDESIDGDNKQILVPEHDAFHGDAVESDELDLALGILLSDFDSEAEDLCHDASNDKETDISSNDACDEENYMSIADCQRMEETCAEAERVLEQYRRSRAEETMHTVDSISASPDSDHLDSNDLDGNSTAAPDFRTSSDISDEFPVNAVLGGTYQYPEDHPDEGDCDYYTQTLLRLSQDDPTLETLEIYNPMEWDLEKFRDEYGDLDLCGLFAAMSKLLAAARLSQHLKRLEFCYISRLDNPIMREEVIRLVRSKFSSNYQHAKKENEEEDNIKGIHLQRHWDRILIDECGGIGDEFFMELLQDSNIASLHLIHNVLSSTCISVLGNALQAPPMTTCLRELRLTEIMTPSSMLYLADGIAGNTSLATLDITGSLFANKEATTANLASGLSRNGGLRTLNISRCDLEDEHVAVLVRSLVQHSSLVWLDLSNNLCGSKSCDELSSLLGNDKDVNSRLSGLTLTCCGIDDNGAVAILEPLFNNTHLSTLHLSENKITDSGVTNVAKILRDLKTLKTLWLTENEFSGDGAKQLLNAMKGNVEVEQLAIDRHLDHFDEIQFYAALNKAGRRLLAASPNNVPLALWPMVLDRCHRIIAGNYHMFRDRRRIGTADLQFYLLHGPVLLQSPPSKGCK